MENFNVLHSDLHTCNTPDGEGRNGKLPIKALEAILVKSASMPLHAQAVCGYDFNRGVNYDALLRSYGTTGFQATYMARAIDEINRMLECRRMPKPDDCSATNNCTIFLSFTSNMISSGLREVFRYIVQHKLVDVVVTTAGGVEEDLIKCLSETYIGSFALKGSELRRDGINRIGNLLAPNENYCRFEDWVMPIFDAMFDEQTRHSNPTLWTPQRMVARLGQEINNPDSVMYWCWRNDIPVFSPALTDGSLGDMLYFHSHRRDPGIVLDIVQDVRKINTMAVRSANTGMIILGGGLIKHHTCNANLMRNGADFAVYINTANEFDGSDAGATPDEAVSWGKIRPEAQPVKVCADASLVFPIIVAQTFAKHVEAEKSTSSRTASRSANELPV